MINVLAREASPYLRRHADQAIAWQRWSEDAFAAAAAQDKPVLVSIGYLACHWCHVMATETFSQPSIAAIVNRDFIAIKVDREERPDVDRATLDAMVRLGARTGWPVTAFMTPQGELFAGGSYYPPEPRHGLPGFPDVLAQAAQAYHSRDEPNESGLRATHARQAAPPPSFSPIADIERYAIFLADQLLDNVDTVYGGFGIYGPRFPNAAAHLLLWRRYMASGAVVFGEAVVESLSRIGCSALVDHVGGGVHRYCVDDAWTLPHFEKMLYDNAMLLELLSWVWRERRTPALKRCAEGIADWALREMLTSDGGFAASLGAYADGDPEDGAFYRWHEAELRAALGDEAAVFLRSFEIGGSAGVLRRREPELGFAVDEDRLHRCLATLAARRAGRARPIRDDKVLADWNGLMLVALIEAGSVFDRRDWLASARKVFDSLTERLARGGRLHHCVTGGVPGPDGFLDDYAMMSRAALRLYEAFGKQAYLDHAEAWVATLDAAFWDRDAGGYCMSASGGWQPTPRVRTISESSLPPGNALMIGVLARLHALTGDSAYRRRAEALVAAFHRDIIKSGLSCATAVDNVLTLANFVKITVTGKPTHRETRALLGAALDYGLPDRMVLGPGADRDVAEGAAPMAQVCIGTTCLLPMTDADALRAFTAPGGLARATA